LVLRQKRFAWHACTDDKQCNSPRPHGPLSGSVNLAASPVGRILRFSLASFLIKSQPARASSLFVPMAVLETSGLTLHRFCEDDVDLLSGLIANQDFMRFSLGVYTREQTLGVLEKVLARQNANMPSLFAAMLRSNGVLLGYCGFEKIGMSLKKQTIHRGFLTNVFSRSCARWGKESAV
jgi:hypothetical protein